MSGKVGMAESFVFRDDFQALVPSDLFISIFPMKFSDLLPRASSVP